MCRCFGLVQFMIRVKFRHFSSRQVHTSADTHFTSGLSVYRKYIHLLVLCAQILNGLYLGNFRDSRDPAQLTQNCITHIVSVHDNAKPLQPVRSHSLGEKNIILLDRSLN